MKRLCLFDRSPIIGGMAHKRRALGLKHRQWAALILVVALLYIVLPQRAAFSDSWRLLGSAQPVDLALAASLSAVTYLLAAASYCLLAWRRLLYPRTVLVEVASSFANRLLPAGIGGLGTNYVYLRKVRHTVVEAGSVVAANNLLGFIGHLLVVGVLMGVWHNYLPPVQLPFTVRTTEGDVLVIGLAVIVLLMIRSWRQRAERNFRQLGRQLLSYRQRLASLGGALVTSVTLTLCNALSFYWCTRALDIHLSFVAIMLVFTLGVALGTVTPTPGGLGGVEAGLTVGLIAYHVPDGAALAAALAFRLISYWLALVAGALAFVIIERRDYL